MMDHVISTNVNVTELLIQRSYMIGPTVALSTAQKVSLSRTLSGDHNFEKELFRFDQRAICFSQE